MGNPYVHLILGGGLKNTGTANINIPRKPLRTLHSEQLNIHSTLTQHSKWAENRYVHLILGGGLKNTGTANMKIP